MSTGRLAAVRVRVGWLWNQRFSTRAAAVSRHGHRRPRRSLLVVAVYSVAGRRGSLCPRPLQAVGHLRASRLPPSFPVTWSRFPYSMRAGISCVRATRRALPRAQRRQSSFARYSRCGTHGAEVDGRGVGASGTHLVASEPRFVTYCRQTTYEYWRDQSNLVAPCIVSPYTTMSPSRRHSRAVYDTRYWQPVEEVVSGRPSVAPPLMGGGIWPSSSSTRGDATLFSRPLGP